MNNYRKILMPAIVLLQVAVLVFMAAKQEHILAAGEKVLLRCEPVDPRSLFSGDYVILNYADLSRIDMDRVRAKDAGDRALGRNDVIYIALVKPAGGKYWEPAAASHDFSWIKGSYRTVIRGRVDGFYNIKFGLEDYFVPQNEGRIIEQDLAKVSVEVSVMPDGSSAISRLFLDDKEVKFY